jgi:deoxyribonuclease V
LTAWAASFAELERRQQELASSDAGTAPLPPRGLRAVGSCYVCVARGHAGRGERGDALWAGAAVVRGHRVHEIAAVSARAGAPYVPGYLALRVGHALEAAVRALEDPPDFLLVNGSGRDHPRGAGLAVHLGAVLDIPTVGVTDRCLCASGDPPGEERGARAPLTWGGETVGWWLRTRAGARPVAVHAGWRTIPDTALEIVAGCTHRARTPEPLRRARHAARMARAGLHPTAGRQPM